MLHFGTFEQILFPYVRVNLKRIGRIDNETDFIFLLLESADDEMHTIRDKFVSASDKGRFSTANRYKGKRAIPDDIAGFFLAESARGLVKSRLANHIVSAVPRGSKSAMINELLVLINKDMAIDPELKAELVMEARPEFLASFLADLLIYAVGVDPKKKGTTISVNRFDESLISEDAIETFSPTTLEVLRNLTQDDFKLFRMFCTLLLVNEGTPRESAYPFVLHVRDFSSMEVSFICSGIGAPEYIQLEALGLISHPRQQTLYTWQKNTNGQIIEGAVLSARTQDKCLVIQAKPGSSDQTFTVECSYLTTAGWEIYKNLFMEEEINGLYLTLLSKTLEENELDKPTPRFRFCLFPSTINPETGEEDYDFSHDLQKEKTLALYGVPVESAPETPDPFAEGLRKSANKYLDYLAQFPDLG